MKELVEQLASEQRGRLIEYRRHLHQHPELSFQEVQTSAWIREKLTELGIPILEGFSGNSVVGLLDSGITGPTIAFRADMDALPVQELADVPFKSENPGVAHACGHDCHVATLMSLAEILSKHRELIKGRVKFIFQQSEEVFPGGAKTLVEEGVMKDVDMIFGSHVTSMAGKTGDILVGYGARTSLVITYKVTIEGKGGHGGNPHLATNPIPAAAELVQAIYGIITDDVDAKKMGLVTVGFLQAGTEAGLNVIPNKVVLGGNIRSYEQDVGDLIVEKIKKAVDGICSWRECKGSVEFDYGYPSAINDKQATDLVCQVAERLGKTVIMAPPLGGGEDFSYYSLEKPGCFFRVSVRNPDDPATHYPQHNPSYCVDENGMVSGLEMFLSIYLNCVEEE